MKNKKAKKPQSRALAVHKPQLPAVPKTILEVIADAARDPKVDVQKLQQLLNMRRAEQDREAEIIFNAALGEAQKEIVPVKKGSVGDKSKPYASLEQVSRAIDPTLRNHGFSLSYGMADSPIAAHYRITAKLSLGAWSRDYFIDLAVDDVGPKGERNKTAVQGAGSTISYGRRYLKLMIFDVTLTNEDNDGAGNGALITPDQINELIELADAAGADKRGFCEFLGVESFANIPAKRYPEAKIALRSYKAGRKAAAVA